MSLESCMSGVKRNISVYITSVYMYMYHIYIHLYTHIYALSHTHTYCYIIQFDTNVSQLLRRVLPCSCDPLPSLGELSSSSLNPLSVCLSCMFCLCIPPVVYGSPILSLLCLRVALFSKEKKILFFFQKKWTDVRPDERLTSGIRRQPHPT
jgi:hypothetical protein